MLEVLTGFVGKTFGSFVGPLWRYWVATFRRPSIALKKAPRNVLEHLKPSASQDHVRAVLGPAHQVMDQCWFYRFADVLIQIEFWKGSGAKCIALGLVGNRKEHRFPVPNCAMPLGQLSIADAPQEQDMLRYRNSLRHEEIIVEVRLGPTGAWSNWTFGAMMAVGSHVLHESYFEWNSETKRLKIAPSLVMVNWVAVSDSSDEVYFDWSMG